MNNPPTKTDRMRRRTLFVLALATAVGSAGLATGGTAGALLGVQITGTEAAAGLPLGLLVVGSAAAALLISRRTGRAGRGRSLALGYVLGTIGTALVVTSAVASNLTTLLVGSTLLGAGNAAILLTRYAAAEVGDEAARGRALGVVFFATTLGAVVSPFLLGPSGDLARMLGLPSLTGLYVVAILCFATSALLLTVAASGILLLVGAGIAGALIDQGGAFSITAFLAVLGIGWNCGVVGGSMLLAASVPTTLRPHVEGLGEVAMGLAAGAGAPLAGIVVAFGDLTALAPAGAATAMLALVGKAERVGFEPTRRLQTAYAISSRRR